MLKSACVRLRLYAHTHTHSEMKSGDKQRSHYTLRPNKICMDFGLNQNPVAACKMCLTTIFFCFRRFFPFVFFFGIFFCCLLAFEGHTHTHTYTLSWRYVSRSLYLFSTFVHRECADFSEQFYCIIYTDKRFPFNINVKFIANIMQKMRAFLSL